MMTKKNIFSVILRINLASKKFQYCVFSSEIFVLVLVIFSQEIFKDIQTVGEPLIY